MIERPKVGVGVLIKRNGKILLGKRKNAHGTGSWSAPGGHLEYGESFAECGTREVEEETGLKVECLEFGTVTNDIFQEEGKHYITIIMIAEAATGEPEVQEPDKCEGWEWFSWDNLPEPLFLPISNVIKQGFNPIKL